MSFQKKLIIQKNINSENEIHEFVFELKRLLTGQDMLLLSGDLGAGKTTFTRYLCESFGYQFSQSPTYAVHQSYHNQQIKIEHLDLYRLENQDQLESVGFWDLIKSQSQLFIIEWYEKTQRIDWIEELSASKQILGLKIIKNDDDSRSFHLYQFKF